MNDTVNSWWDDNARTRDFDAWLARRSGLYMDKPLENEHNEWVYKFTFSFVTTISCMFLALTLAIIIIVACFMRRPARRGSFRLLLSNNEDIELSEIGETESVLSSDGGTSVKRSVSAMSQSICQHCGKLSSYNINEVRGGRRKSSPTKSTSKSFTNLRVANHIKDRVKKSHTSGSLRAMLLPVSDTFTGLTKKSYSYTNLTEHEDVAQV